jgi:hypothetical protein
MHRTIFALLALCIGLTGCASSKHSYSANGTTVTTDTKQNTVTVQASGETMTVGSGVVDASKLGVPIYAGAKQEEGGYSMTGAKGSAQMTSFTTPDSFDRVYAFYHSKMPAGSEKMKIDSGGSSMAEFVVGNNTPGTEQTMVMISKKGTGTAIVITKGTGQK